MKERGTEIEKGVPLPQRREKADYPFSKMDVGDSFLSDRSPKAVASAARNWAIKRPGYKFRTSTQDGMTRCWRSN